MNANDIRAITLPKDDWPAIYRVLSESKDWNHVITEIKNQCQGQAAPATVELKQAWAWSMSATIRPTIPEVADRVAVQLGMVW